MFGGGHLNDTEARAFHLCFALFIVVHGVSRVRDLVAHARATHTAWLLAAAPASAAVLYLVVFYNDLAQRPGLPTRWDVAAAIGRRVGGSDRSLAPRRGCRGMTDHRRVAPCSMSF
jgi:TRAP-type uncharacterized transport system fused permease subunit